MMGNPNPPKALPLEDDAALTNAVNSATAHRLQIVLRAICDANPDAKGVADSMLLTEDTPSKETPSKETPSKETSTNDADVNSSLKRKRPSKRQRYQICGHCHEEYDVLDNPEDACAWHEGKSLR